jgi:hypothetical protein
MMRQQDFLIDQIERAASPQQQEKYQKNLKAVHGELKRLIRDLPREFEGEPPQASPPKPRYPKSSKPQKSSSLKRQIVMDTEELSGGRPTRRRRARRITRKRKGFMKRSNK